MSKFPTDAPLVPAVLDPGFNGTFLISQRQFEEWAGLQVRDAPWIDVLSVEGRLIPLRDADVWIHRNRPGSRDPAPGSVPFRLELPEGVAVWPTAIPGARRLPLLGMRALRQAGL
ncbi:MAG: hypothetical protein HY040_21820 [Planctomycetes bacterium]|nr:hypothetical protein [Planctomycetota bacterium]